MTAILSSGDILIISFQVTMYWINSSGIEEADLMIDYVVNAMQN